MDNTNDHAGRIPKHAFIISVLILLGICVLTTAARFYIRIRYQKQVSIDDGFLLFGLCCMISSVGVIFVFIDSLYLLEAIEFGTSLAIPRDFIEQVWIVQKFSAVSLVLGWFSIVSVKLSFLFFFRKLVDRVKMMKVYWWVVLVFNVAISCYGVTVYFVACPHFYYGSYVQCGTGSSAWRTVKFSVSQIVLDVVGDLLILYIPIHLVLHIQIRWTQKLALLSSLCLTCIIITITIVKASGLRHGTEIDTVWEVYFQTISAEVGIVMTAITAFRTFFVARSNEKSRETGSTTSSPSIYSKFSPKYWLSRSSQRMHSNEVDKDDTFGMSSKSGAGTIGVRTFIESGAMMRDESGMSGLGGRMGVSCETGIGGEGADDLWPLQRPARTLDKKSIMVQRDISFLSERNSSSSEDIYESAV